MLNRTQLYDLKNFEGLYKCDKLGNIYSIKCNKKMKPYVKNGYYAIKLMCKQKQKHYYVHRLIAETFIENKENKKEVNHIDCDKLNNNVNNLEWCTRKENLQHSYDNGLKRQGEKHGNHKLTLKQVKEIREKYSKGFTYYQLMKIYNVTYSTIYNVCNFITWKEGDNNVNKTS